MGCLAPGGFHGKLKARMGPLSLGEEEVPPSTHTQFLILALTSETGSRVPQYIRVLPDTCPPPHKSLLNAHVLSPPPLSAEPQSGMEECSAGEGGYH